MQEHVMYWKDLAGRGIAVVFGPVADPNGAWGAIVEDEADARALAENDPTVKSDRNFNFEILFDADSSVAQTSCLDF